jgi:hypothetical protein
VWGREKIAEHYIRSSALARSIGPYFLRINGIGIMDMQRKARSMEPLVIVSI